MQCSPAVRERHRAAVAIVGSVRGSLTLHYPHQHRGSDGGLGANASVDQRWLFIKLAGELSLAENGEIVLTHTPVNECFPAASSILLG